MKEMVKRTAVVTLAGVMSVGMLSGCGSKDLDGTKTVATVDGTDIPLGVVSLYAREQQQQTTSMYLSYMGSADNIWDQTADEDSGETYGDQAVTSSLKSIEKMYILKEKASDYDVALTDDDETAIADAASGFMASNGEDTIKELGVTEDQVKTLLELQTIQKKMYDPVVAEGNITVSDDEANQTTFTYGFYDHNCMQPLLYDSDGLAFIGNHITIIKFLSSLIFRLAIHFDTSILDHKLCIHARTYRTGSFQCLAKFNIIFSQFNL